MRIKLSGKKTECKGLNDTMSVTHPFIYIVMQASKFLEFCVIWKCCYSSGKCCSNLADMYTLLQYTCIALRNVYVPLAFSSYQLEGRLGAKLCNNCVVYKVACTASKSWPHVY